MSRTSLPLTVQCAGRTDTGVHALERVVHFNPKIERELHAWMLGGNSNLPEIQRYRPFLSLYHS